MNFSEHMQAVTKENKFKERGYYVWCGSMTKEGDTYGLVYSRWDYHSGMESWVIQSEICLATAKSPYGPFKHEKVLLTKQEKGWDRDCAHNPVILEHNGKYYLYYMGNYGKGDFWSHRNHQRIGVAVADSMYGPFVRKDAPVLDVSESGFDNLMVSNPSVIKTPEGKFLMMYKGVDDNGPMPKGGKVVCGTAIADNPEGPFQKTGKPLFINPEHNFSVEDPCIFYYENKYYCIVKDFYGYFSKAGANSTAMFQSDNGLDGWELCENSLGYIPQIQYTDGTTECVSKMERPQIYFEDGKPKVLCCAVAADNEWKDTYNLQIPLDF